MTLESPARHDFLRGGTRRPAPMLRPPWALTEFTERCTRRDNCERGAIRFQLQPGGRAFPLIDDQDCSGCGAFVASCPAQAVTMIEVA